MSVTIQHYFILFFGKFAWKHKKNYSNRGGHIIRLMTAKWTEKQKKHWSLRHFNTQYLSICIPFHCWNATRIFINNFASNDVQQHHKMGVYPNTTLITTIQEWTE